jgi:hypothetical protein
LAQYKLDNIVFYARVLLQSQIFLRSFDCDQDWLLCLGDGFMRRSLDYAEETGLCSEQDYVHETGIQRYA